MTYSTDSNFNSKFIQGADAIFQGLLHDRNYDSAFPLEHRYANLRLPRQCGKTVYLCGLANLLANLKPESTQNVWFLSGMHREVSELPIPLSSRIQFISMKGIKSITDFHMREYRGQSIDFMLFDEVHPSITAQILTDAVMQPVMASSRRFVAFGLHTMDTVSL